jgi:hypothetical protein
MLANGALDNRISELCQQLKVSHDLFERSSLRNQIEALEAEHDSDPAKGNECP